MPQMAVGLSIPLPIRRNWIEKSRLKNARISVTVIAAESETGARVVIGRTVVATGNEIRIEIGAPVIGGKTETGAAATRIGTKSETETVAIGTAGETGTNESGIQTGEWTRGRETGGGDRIGTR
eukprot:Rmarinus@m.1283